MARGTGGGSGVKLTGSVIAGLLLVPASAIAAVAIVTATSGTPAAEAMDETTTTVAQLTTTTVVEALDVLDDSGKIEDACTVDAQKLIEHELDGSITDLQAAALDALREVCDQNGMPIAGPPAPEPVTRVVTVATPAPASTTTAPDSTESTYGDDHRGDDDDEYEHEDEDHEDEHHEDEDHEDD